MVYRQDALLIRTARFDEVTKGKFKFNDLGVHIVPPLLKDIGDYNLDKLEPVDFSYRAIMCHVDIEKPEGRAYMTYLESSTPDKGVLLQFDGTSGRFQISGELSKTITEQVMTKLCSDAP